MMSGRHCNHDDVYYQRVGIWLKPVSYWYSCRIMISFVRISRFQEYTQRRRIYLRAQFSQLCFGFTTQKIHVVEGAACSDDFSDHCIFVYYYY